MSKYLLILLIYIYLHVLKLLRNDKRKLHIVRWCNQSAVSTVIGRHGTTDQLECF